jgi:hypothetical protein
MQHAAVLEQRRSVCVGAKLVTSLLDPSTSVNRRVTVPVGRSLRTRITFAESDCYCLFDVEL